MFIMFIWKKKREKKNIYYLALLYIYYKGNFTTIYIYIYIYIYSFKYMYLLNKSERIIGRFV